MPRRLPALADGNYDASDLYDRAAAQGYQLVAAHRKAKNPGSGGHYQSPYRLRGIALLHSFGSLAALMPPA